MKTFLGSDIKAISLVDLKKFPTFLRFNRVNLLYRISLQLQSIEEKCQLIASSLKSIKETLNDSNKIVFNGCIDQNDQSDFNNHSTLVGYIQDEFLPVCDSSCLYKFDIEFYSDKNSGAKVIASILKMPQIIRCSSVEIGLWQISDPIQIPIEGIVQWLNQNNDRIGFIGKKKEEKFLKIYSGNIGNVSAMCEHLKEVLFIS